MSLPTKTLAVISALLGSTSAAYWDDAKDGQIFKYTCTTAKDANNQCYAEIYNNEGNDATVAFNSCCASFLQYGTLESSTNTPTYRCMTDAQREEYGAYYETVDNDPSTGKKVKYQWTCLDNLRYWSDEASGLKFGAATAVALVAATLY